MTRNLQIDSAYAVIELLVSLAISSTLLGMMMVTFTQSSMFYATSTQELKASLQKEKLTHVLNDISREYSVHRFNLPVRIHPGGQIRYTDMTDNPITNRTGLRAPSQISDAVTSSELAFFHTLRVLDVQTLGHDVHFKACPRFSLNIRKQTESLGKIRNYLGVGVDGLIELSGKSKPWPNKRFCKILTLEPTQKSMLTQPFSSASPEFIRLLIPIRRLYTLYLDNSGTLRFLSHVGNQNIENQPILEGMEQILFNEERVLSGLHPYWSVHLNSGKPKVDEIVSLARISKLHNYQLLMNLM